MSPTSRLLIWAVVWLLLGAVATYAPVLIEAWAWIGAFAALVAGVDLGWLFFQRPLVMERRLPGRIACGQSGEVALVLRNPGGQFARIEVFDGIPQGSVADAMPWSGLLPPHQEARVFYQVKTSIRGEAWFGPVHVKRASRLGLWARRTLHLSPDVVRVYPNYEPVVRFALLAMQHRENPMGIVRRARAGSSRDFHQLRDYHDGDPLSQIDWKATSRRQVLISRDYQEQRNQSVVFLLDTGRRMRAMEDGVPQFDHVLNALLFVAYVALGQGDQVAVKSFGGVDRWLPPMKGSHAMPVLLNHLYDYQTTAATSDFASGVKQLMTRQRRRSLVILLTNLRAEDGKELLPVLQVLGTRHLVLLASLQEQFSQDAVVHPVESFAGSLRFLAAHRYLRERQEVMAALGSAGVLTLDSTARDFPVALANRYLDIKSAGRL